MKKRIQRRYHHQAPIVYKRISSESENFFGGETKNYSKNGVCFQANQALEPGIDVILAWTDVTDLPQKLFGSKTNDSNIGYEEDYRACRGKIVWCEEKVNNRRFAYGVGVKVSEVNIRIFK